MEKLADAVASLVQQMREEQKIVRQWAQAQQVQQNEMQKLILRTTKQLPPSDRPVQPGRRRRRRGIGHGASSCRRRRHYEAPYWPGFVDAMAQLLLVITFLLSVFIVAQFLLAREISGQDSALGQLRSQIAELTELLALEKSAKAELELNLSTLGDDLESEKAKSANLALQLEGESEKGESAGSDHFRPAHRAR